MSISNMVAQTVGHQDERQQRDKRAIGYARREDDHSDKEQDEQATIPSSSEE
ncbi:hypothetical protein A0J61_11789, partial [Choanephora cucurbitarum]